MSTKKRLPLTHRKPWSPTIPTIAKGRLKNIGGSQSDHWNNTLANQAMQALWLKNSSSEERDKAVERHGRRAGRASRRRTNWKA